MFKNKPPKGPKVIYHLTQVEGMQLRTYAQVIQGLNAAITEAVKTIAIRQRLSPDDVQFDGERMAFVAAPPKQEVPTEVVAAQA